MRATTAGLGSRNGTTLLRSDARYRRRSQATARPDSCAHSARSSGTSRRDPLPSPRRSRGRAHRRRAPASRRPSGENSSVARRVPPRRAVEWPERPRVPDPASPTSDAERQRSRRVPSTATTTRSACGSRARSARRRDPARAVRCRPRLPHVRPEAKDAVELAGRGERPDEAQRRGVPDPRRPCAPWCRGSGRRLAATSHSSGGVRTRPRYALASGKRRPAPLSRTRPRASRSSSAEWKSAARCSELTRPCSVQRTLRVARGRCGASWAIHDGTPGKNPMDRKRPVGSPPRTDGEP